MVKGWGLGLGVGGGVENELSQQPTALDTFFYDGIGLEQISFSLSFVQPLALLKAQVKCINNIKVDLSVQYEKRITIVLCSLRFFVHQTGKILKSSNFGYNNRKL